MIGHIAGSPVFIGTDFAIISAGGVGYKVCATADTIESLSVGIPTELWTHLAVREQALDLYGFPDREALHFFELLMSVSGIGPKSALSILSIAHIETLRSAIAQGDPSYLTKVAGIGKKTAEKIVVELSDKVGLGNAAEAGVRKGDEDALAALHSMGYTMQEARDALRLVSRDVTGSSARLKEALKSLGR
jgi:Holliday junction DNA helicase RuvA